MNMYERIKKLRLQQGLSQDELAEKVGYTHRSSIGKVESGLVDLPQSKIKAFAEALHTTPQHLMGFDANQDEEIYQKVGLDYIRIPLYGSICCGDGGFNEDNIIDRVPVPSSNLSKTAEYFALIASGDSMIDAGISEGDLLVFEKNVNLIVGMIGCFCIDENEAMCKKLAKQNNIFILTPMNSNYEPIVIDPLNDNFKCLGKLKTSIKHWE